MSNPLPLTKLIGKAAWKHVLESLTSDPQQAKEPIPTTWSSSNVYPLHQAVSRKSSKPIPPCVLKALINCNPQALDYYAFLGSCENERAHIDVIETLFAEASMETLLKVQTHANDLTLAALGNDNAEIIGLFCNKYPHLLKGDILYQACKNGTPNCVAAILQSAQKHKASIVGCLMDHSKHDGTKSSSSEGNEESPLEVSNRLFDKKNPERMATLAICVQYASASRAETGGSDLKNGYPLPVAAIGWVSPQICKDIILTERQRNEAGRSVFVEKCALEKAMHMVYEKPDFDQIPEVFQNQDLIKACKKKCPEEVYKILRKDKKATRKLISRKHNGENALDVAIKVYKEKDEKSCEVLSICVKHINAIKMNLQESSTESPYEYPTAFAAVGYVTNDVLHSIFSKFKHEIRTKLNGKLAIKKLLYLGLGGGDYCNYTNRLEKKYMFSMEGKPKKSKQITWASMETIFEYSGSGAA